MDKIEKALKRLSEKEKKSVKEIIMRLTKFNLTGLNISKLKGHKDILRVRKGDLRVIYRSVGKEIFILAIERRNEKTYKGF